jgi:hypothetical protein
MIRLSANIYVSDARVNFYGASIQTRMAVIKLSDGSLLVYSPISLTADVKKQLAELGSISCVVAPNKIHNQSLDDYAAEYPNAKIFASPGLPERKPNIHYAGVLKDEPEQEWERDIEQVLTKGNVFFSEVILYHKSSKTLLVCDFVENLNKSTSSMMPLFKLFGVKEKPMASPEFRMYTTNEEQARQALEKVQAWDFERIFLCHGDIIEHDAKGIFKSVCSEYLDGVQRKGWILKKLSTFAAKYQ